MAINTKANKTGLNNNKSMTFQEFIKLYDKDNAVILLEGKRNVAAVDKEKLRALGQLLASSTIKMTFRSGNADGADQLFSEGVCAVDRKRLQLITPYTGHRQKSNQAYETISLDEIHIAQELEAVFQSKSNTSASNRMGFLGILDEGNYPNG